MKIGIDARIFGVKETGLGRYTENLVGKLLEFSNKYQFVLFTRKKDLEDIKLLLKQKSPQHQNRVKIVLADIRHYTFREQFLMPFLINKERVDLMHFPHFNVPVFYFGPYVVTIHDLIKHEYRGIETTTRSPIFYWLKYAFYLLVVWWAVKRARKIIVPSNWVKKKVVKKYRVDPERVVVTYEGVGKNIKYQISNIKYQSLKVLEEYKIKKPYLIYVGSVYPHKNVGRLVEAVKVINQKPKTKNQKLLSLVIVCSRSVFWERLKGRIEEVGAQKYVNLLGFVPDEDLFVLLRNARAFVFPSLSEGFGLPGLEAMAVGTPVICSDIPVFREVYGKAADYFDLYDVEDIVQKILKVLRYDAMTHHSRAEEGLKRVKQFSWEKCAKETLKVYEEAVNL